MKKSEMTMKFMEQDIENQEEKICKLKEYLAHDLKGANSNYDYLDISRKANELASEIAKLGFMKENFLRIQKAIRFVEEEK